MAKAKKVKPQASKKTYVALVLDRSGSMALCRQKAVEGFNDQMQVIKENAAKGGDTHISVIVFNGLVEVQQDAVPADKIEKLTFESYQPNGSTAMLDAVWDAITSLEKHDDKNEQTAFLVVTISDGEENASMRTTSAKLAEKIQQLENTKRWTFGYVGANQDLSVISESFHIPTANTYTYTADAAGYNVMNNSVACSAKRYMALRDSGTTFSTQYFADSDDGSSTTVAPSTTVTPTTKK